jgi:hypothetical protein
MIPKLVQLEDEEENCQLAVSNQSLNIKEGIKVLDMFRQTIPQCSSIDAWMKITVTTNDV